MLGHYLEKLLSKASLTTPEMESAMECILGEADPHQIAAFLTILKYRGETIDEMAAMIQILEKKALSAPMPFSVLDIVGTGGDRAHTVNISTGAAILAAACGVPIAKHGSRAVSSRCGSADVLEALGISVEIPPEMLSECIQETNIAFMYAPKYHPCLKKISAIRKGLKFPTVFNMLGPLLNPAKAQYGLIGVACEAALETMSQVILKLGSKKRVLIFHGNGLDELTPLGLIKAYDICAGQRTFIEIDPRVLGFSPCSLKDLQGGDVHTNALLLKEAFSGKKGAISDSLIFTAGAALWIFGSVSLLSEGVQMARSILEEGKALQILKKWKNFSEKFSGRS